MQSLQVDHWSQQLETIGDHAFTWAIWNASAALELPSSLQTIGESAFDFYRGSSDLTIPASVTWIGRYAFACAGLATGSIAVRFLGLPPNLTFTPFECSLNSGSDGINRKFYYGLNYAFDGSDTEAGHVVPGAANYGCCFIHEDYPTITTPQSATVALGSKVVLSVTVTSQLTAFPEAPRIQWFHQSSGTPGQWQGNAIAGATEPTLTLPAVSQADTGTYWAEASDWTGFSRSALAEVKIGTPGGGNGAPPASSGGGAGSAGSSASQTLRVKLPKKLKKRKTYLLPKTTAQGQTVKYRFAKNKKKNAFCAVKNVKVKVKVKKKVHGKIKVRYKKVKRLALVCKKPSKKKTFWIQATAPGNASLQPLTIRWNKRKVK